MFFRYYCVPGGMGNGQRVSSNVETILRRLDVSSWPSSPMQSPDSIVGKGYALQAEKYLAEQQQQQQAAAATMEVLAIRHIASITNGISQTSPFLSSSDGSS